MFRLVDLLKLQGVTLENESYKIHLATHEESPPFDAYLAGSFKEWQEDQTKKNFECQMVLSLIYRGGDRWLFVGVYRVNGVRPGQTTGFKYETELLPGHEELIGRVVVKYKKWHRQSYIWGDRYGAELEVAELLDSALSIEKLPGYNNIRILHSKLVLLVSKEEPSWKSALSSVGGVYLITDILTGRSMLAVPPEKAAFGNDGGLILRQDMAVMLNQGTSSNRKGRTTGATSNVLCLKLPTLRLRLIRFA